MKNLLFLIALFMFLSCGTVVIPEYADIIGIYRAEVSSALGVNQTVTVYFNDDHSAEMMTEYDNIDEVSTESGTWLVGDDGYIEVIFNRTEGVPLYPEETMLFELDGYTLHGVEYNEFLYGSDEFVLNRI